ncbi:branched-chain amino acid ABC transporter permease [Archaeoglobales archaeon]|nr:MAG: branched-chain amino acid ABC transporter permease [Archaeoglobales archaeon]
MKNESLALILLIFLSLLIPLTENKYLLYLSLKIWILILYAIAFNVIFGYSGLLSFGHALFFSGSAYVLAILAVKAEYPLPIGFIAGIAAAAAFSIGVGFLSLRHREIHFAMITLAFSMMFWGIVMKWRDVTGGEDGIAGVPRGMPIFWFYYFSVAIILLCAYIIYRFVRSDIGLILEGIRENETRVKFSGHSTLKYRLYAMIVSGTFTGVAGSLWAMLDRTVTPSISHWSFSAMPVIATLIGGPQSFLGPAVGTVIYVIAQDVITKYTLYWQFILGIVIVSVVLFFRGGVMGIFERFLWKR